MSVFAVAGLATNAARLIIGDAIYIDGGSDIWVDLRST
jgi:hypothetical protein